MTTRSTPYRNQLLLLVSLCAGPVAQSAVQTSCNHGVIESEVDALLARRPDLPGLSLLAGAHGLETWRRHFGSYTDDTIVPVASASKLASAVLMMMLVDEGLIGLDEPVSTYLPAFSGDKGQMSLRQMFSHTSGLPGNRDSWLRPTDGSQILADRSLTLAQAVDQIACCVPMIAAPGEVFSYGGLSMQVAGRVAEVVTGEDFEVLFKQRVSAPLGITTMDFQGLGPTRNYRVAGSLRTTLGDYGRLLQMLSNGGVYQGRRLLSEASIVSLMREQKRDKRLVYEPPVASQHDLGYGLGSWLHGNANGAEVSLLSSKGAFDSLPWIDVSNNAYGMIFVENHAASLNEEVMSLLQTISMQSVDPDCRQPVDMAINAGLSGAWYNPDTSGQGMMIDILADSQTLFAAWFTYDDVAVNSSREGVGSPDQRWLTLQGSFVGQNAELLIFSSSGGQFDLPSQVSTEPVGHATLWFESCDQALLFYQLNQIDRSSQVSLQRLTEDDLCVAMVQATK